MLASKVRISKVGIVAGLVVLVLLVGVAQLSLAGDGPDVTSHFSIVPDSAAEDDSCTPGPTGGCAVQYVEYAGTTPQADCNSSACKVRVETRW